MELYLRWLERHGIEESEASPLGLILCAEGSHEQIELLELDKTSIHVAEYLTELPSNSHSPPLIASPGGISDGVCFALPQQRVFG